jgi:hypothetical protein
MVCEGFVPPGVGRAVSAAYVPRTFLRVTIA